MAPGLQLPRVPTPATRLSLWPGPSRGRVAGILVKYHFLLFNLFIWDRKDIFYADLHQECPTFFCMESLFFFFFVFSGPHPWQMGVPRLGVELELQLLSYSAATATPDLSSVCDIPQSSQQCWDLNPRSKARDWTCILMDASWVHYCWATMGTLRACFNLKKFIDLQLKVLTFQECIGRANTW